MNERTPGARQLPAAASGEPAPAKEDETGAAQRRPRTSGGKSKASRASVAGPAPARLGKRRGAKSEERPSSAGKRNAELGRRGEDAAARFLERRGYDIVERNWTCAAGEADIVARDEETVVFVEVKTRSNCEKGLPSEAVNQKKRDRYERIAALFLQGYDVVDVPVRFDIVSIVAIGPDRALIRHHINAFAAR